MKTSLYPWSSSICSIRSLVSSKKENVKCELSNLKNRFENYLYMYCNKFKENPVFWKLSKNSPCLPYIFISFKNNVSIIFSDMDDTRVFSSKTLESSNRGCYIRSTFFAINSFSLLYYVLTPNMPLPIPSVRHLHFETHPSYGVTFYYINIQAKWNLVVQSITIFCINGIITWIANCVSYICQVHTLNPQLDQLLN